MNRRFRSPNAGQTSLTLQHSTSPGSGYKPALGHNRDGYPTGGIPVHGYRSGGRVGLKKGGSDKNWIQDVNKSIKKRGTKGKCTKWFTNLWILVVASVFGIKGTQVFRNGGGKK